MLIYSLIIIFNANDCFVYFQWQQSAGTCQFQIKVCGFRQPGVTQDNWLFTQHISKSLDANTNNYPVEILVDIIYALQRCRSNRNPPCNTRFTLYRYITTSQQLPSTSGSGFMNKDNYVSFGTATPASTGARYTETHRFTLQSQHTGFYIAIEDTGTCVIISRLLVYRHCSYCSAQAPGDEDVRCLRPPYVHTYEDNVKVLHQKPLELDTLKLIVSLFSFSKLASTLLSRTQGHV